MNARTAEYRCADCGALNMPVLFDGGYRAMQCPAHPDADTLSWDWGHQAAAIYACQRVEQLRHTFDQIFEELVQMDFDDAPAVGTDRYNNLMAVLPLLIAWEGLPERRLEASAPVPSLY